MIKKHETFTKVSCFFNSKAITNRESEDGF